MVNVPIQIVQGHATHRPGEPVLVFEAGYGGAGSLTFTDLYPALSKFVAGIGYDRNGEGGMDQFRMMNYAAMIANNHHSGVVLLPGYQHFVYKQDPELVVSAIRRVYESAVTRVKVSGK